MSHQSPPQVNNTDAACIALNNEFPPEMLEQFLRLRAGQHIPRDWPAALRLACKRWRRAHAERKYNNSDSGRERRVRYNRKKRSPRSNGRHRRSGNTSSSEDGVSSDSEHVEHVEPVAELAAVVGLQAAEEEPLPDVVPPIESSSEIALVAVPESAAASPVAGTLTSSSASPVAVLEPEAPLLPIPKLMLGGRLLRLSCSFDRSHLTNNDLTGIADFVQLQQQPQQQQPQQQAYAF